MCLAAQGVDIVTQLCRLQDWDWMSNLVRVLDRGQGKEEVSGMDRGLEVTGLEVKWLVLFDLLQVAMVCMRENISCRVEEKEEVACSTKFIHLPFPPPPGTESLFPLWGCGERGWRWMQHVKKWQGHAPFH